jgi:hypothetical protein
MPVPGEKNVPWVDIEDAFAVLLRLVPVKNAVLLDWIHDYRQAFAPHWRTGFNFETQQFMLETLHNMPINIAENRRKQKLFGRTGLQKDDLVSLSLNQGSSKSPILKLDSDR